MAGGRIPNANPSTTGGSCSTALTLTSGPLRPSLNDLLLLDTQGRVFCGVVTNPVGICNGGIMRSVACIEA